MKKIVILMSTYNGEKYLNEQIDSLIAQKDVDISILVRDDGSKDATISILEKYKSEGILTWYTGQNLKPARSFLDLIAHAPVADYYAFCDQDDVWNDNKLIRAIDFLEELKENDKPLLYCSNYQLVDSKLNDLPDNGHVSTVKFAASLVASNCTGCTTVFNNELLKILQLSNPEIIVMHDDWAHKVCLAVGGKVVYDEHKTLKYRQHGNNADGGIHTFSDKVKQIYKRIKTKERIRSKQIGEIAKIYKDFMPIENYKLATKIYLYVNSNLIERFFLILDKRLRTGYISLDRGFILAILMKYY